MPANNQPCKICRGTGHVVCPNQLCAHWCSCTVCNGTGKVEVYEDWEKGYAEEKVRKPLAPVSSTLDRLLDSRFDLAAEAEADLGEIEHNGEKVMVKIKVVRKTR